MSTSLGASEHVPAVSYKITVPLDSVGSLTLQIAFKQNDSNVGEMGCDAPGPRLPLQAPSNTALTIEVNRHPAVLNPARPPLSTSSQPPPGTSHHAPRCTLLPSPSRLQGVHHRNVSYDPPDSEPPPTNHTGYETQWSEISPSNLAVINSFVDMFDECPGRPKSPPRPSSPALHRPSTPSLQQLPESQLPISDTQLTDTSASASQRHSESDSGSETEPELDPVYDAYCLGYSDGHRRAADGGEGGLGRCSTKHLASCTCEDSMLPVVEDKDDEHPRTYVPTPSTNAGCHLTPRTRKQITADLPQSPVTRAAVKRFKTTHNALIAAREAAKHQQISTQPQWVLWPFEVFPDVSALETLYASIEHPTGHPTQVSFVEVSAENRRLRDEKRDLLTSYNRLRAERDQLQQNNQSITEDLHNRIRDIQLYNTEHDRARNDIGRLTKERDDLDQAMGRYNPEVVNRQEELHDIEQIGSTSHTRNLKLHKKVPTGTRERMRHELSLITPLSTPNIRRESDQLLEFRDWIISRAIAASALDVVPGRATISDQTARLTFDLSEARLCQDPVLYPRDRLVWCTLPEQHGLIFCPEFQYGPSLAYGRDSWTKAAEGRACAEQKREIFYEHDGLVHYAGTYICHSGPSSQKVISLGGWMTEILIRALAHETLSAKRTKKKTLEQELVTIEQLYREGALTVHVLGIERVGFNNALFNKLAKRYRKSRSGAARGPLPFASFNQYLAPGYVPPISVYVPPMAVYRLPIPAPYAPTPALYVPAAPVAGRSSGHLHALAPAPVLQGFRSPPPRYTDNFFQLGTSKRYREDDNLGHPRPAKIPRIFTPLCDDDDNNNKRYLLYEGNDYYRSLLGDDRSEYNVSNLPRPMSPEVKYEDGAEDEISIYDYSEDASEE